MTRPEFEIRKEKLLAILDSSLVKLYLEKLYSGLDAEQQQYLQLVQQELESVLYAARPYITSELQRIEYTSLISDEHRLATLLTNPQFLQQAINILNSVTDAPEGRASLAPEDRRRLVELYEAKLHADKIKQEERDWKHHWEEQIRQYRKLRLQQIENDPNLAGFYKEYELALDRTSYLLIHALSATPDAAKYFASLSELDLRERIEKILEDSISGQKQYLEQLRIRDVERPLTPTVTTTTQTAIQVQKDISELQKLLDRLRAEEKIAEISKRQATQIMVALRKGYVEDYQAGRLLSEAEVLQRTILALGVSRTVADALPPLSSLPQANTAVGILRTAIDSAKTQGRNQLIGEIQKKDPTIATEYQRDFKAAQRRVEELLSLQDGELTTHQFRIIKLNLLTQLKDLEGKVSGEDNIHRVQRLYRATEGWQFEDAYVPKPQEIPATKQQAEITATRQPLVTKDEKALAASRPHLIIDSQRVSETLLRNYLIAKITTDIVRYQSLAERYGIQPKYNQELEKRLMYLTEGDRVAVARLFEVFHNPHHYYRIQDVFATIQLEAEKQSLTLAKKQVTYPPSVEIRKNLREIEAPRKAKPPTEQSIITSVFGNALNNILGAGTALSAASGGFGGNASQGGLRLTQGGPGLPRLPFGVGRVISKAKWSPWLWLSLIIASVVFLLMLMVSTNSPFIFPEGRGGVTGDGTLPDYDLASGTCPVTGDYFITTGIYKVSTGHGSTAYWGGRSPSYPIPICAQYNTGACSAATTCFSPACSYYGLAIDVKARSTGPSETAIVVPNVCPSGQTCTDTDITWTVTNTWYNCAGESSDSPCSAGNDWGKGVILTANAYGQSWQIYLNHIVTSARPGDSFSTAAGSNVVGSLSPTLGNPHLHFEISMAGKPIDPTPFCDGSGDGITSGTCTVPDLPNLCAPAYLSAFGAEAENAAKICYRESGGKNTAVNINCATTDYSVGLFQINLFGNDNIMPAGLRQIIRAAGYPDSESCFDAFVPSAICAGGKPNIKPGYQSMINACVNWLQGVENNIEYASMYQRRSGWNPWSTSAPNVCNVP